jgi:8-oxo-dGTP pyrophosphatase MutT (NUDIX family)
MASGRIRPLALAIIWRGDEVLVQEGLDDKHYRLVGGGIEFGEYGLDAIQREIQEELGAELVDVHYCQTIENLFVLNGNPGHEIVLVFEAQFADQTLYEQKEFHFEDGGDGLQFRAVWRSLDYFHTTGIPIYPNGILNLLTALRG